MKKTLLSIIAILAVIGSLVGAYFLGKSQAAPSADVNSDLEQEVKTLRANESDAAVVKRVSQQMEAIAYQQKAISDKQRDKAEEQSQLAIQMRDRAELESKAAREAEGKAVKAADEAEVQRKNALNQQQLAVEQQRLAEEQRDAATFAKRVSDTLTLRTQGRTIGFNAELSYDNNNKELASLLAYASWYFLDKYKGNTYQSSTFKTLSECTNSMSKDMMSKGGAVTAIYKTEGESYIAVSDYGEIEQHGKTTTVLYHNKQYNFCDVYANGKCVYALSLRGPLCLVTYDKMFEAVDLPEDTYFRILPVGTSTLLIAGRKSLCWFDLSTKVVSSRVELKKTLNAIGKRGKMYNLFFADGSYAEMDNAGTITSKTPLTKKIVTYVFMDSRTNILYLGCDNGEIDMFTLDGRPITTLYGHTSKVTTISSTESVVVSGAYDMTTLIWNMPTLLKKAQELRDEASGKMDGKVYAALEWISPVSYKFGGWSLSSTQISSTDILVGTSKGTLLRFNVSESDMAAKIKKNMKRQLTSTEWNQYVGTNIPYTKF